METLKELGHALKICDMAPLEIRALQVRLLNRNNNRFFRIGLDQLENIAGVNVQIKE